MESKPMPSAFRTDAEWCALMQSKLTALLSDAVQIRWTPGRLFLLADLTRLANTLEHVRREGDRHGL